MNVNVFGSLCFCEHVHDWIEPVYVWEQRQLALRQCVGVCFCVGVLLTGTVLLGKLDF